MLKTLLEPTPRSRSSDNLEKFSPLIGRRSQGDSPLTSSPLARRMTSESSHEKTLHEEGMTESLQRNTLPIVGSSLTSRPALKETSTEETTATFGTTLIKRADSEKSGQVPSVKLRSTGFESTSKNYNDTSKSPVLKSIAKGNGSIGKTTPPITAPKPRPWSMAADRKSGANFLKVFLNFRNKFLNFYFFAFF